MEISRQLNTTNRTIINRCAALTKQGFLIPLLVRERIRSYELSDMAKSSGAELLRQLQGRKIG